MSGTPTRRVKKTNRGFAIFSEFKDSYGIPITVQESSSVDPACWIFVKDDSHAKFHLGSQLQPAVHLTPAQCRRLIRALTRFLEYRGEKTT